MAQVVADRLTGGTRTYTGWDAATRLKLLGVEVASLGDRPEEAAPGAYEATHLDTRAGVYRSLRVSGEGRLLGGTFVGDTSGYTTLRPSWPAACRCPPPSRNSSSPACRRTGRRPSDRSRTRR
ncbi:hypothetical protein F6456_00595 [Streptomyces sp. LBUM 1484]|nr:hypothetical protein [Streptomyces sp. LBUM 1484]